MSNPAPPTLLREDVAVGGWSAITVRVAWTLLRLGVNVKPDTLRNLREHVVFHVNPDWSLQVVEDHAEHLVTQFVHRVRVGDVTDLSEDYAIIIEERWVRSVQQSLNHTASVLLHHHYGDGRPLEEIERRFQTDRIELAAAQAGLRALLRTVAHTIEDIESWPPPRVDTLLRRVAAWTPDACPPIHDVLDGHHYEHAHRCVRCSRARRLVQGGLIHARDLLPPKDTVRPSGQARALALHFHPDARQHRAAVERELSVPAQRIGDDLLLVQADDLQAVQRIIEMAAEVGAPHRDHLRGVMLQGPGRWSRHGLLGPLAARARGAVRSRPWGRVDSLGELPPVLPPPPSAAPIWALVVVLVLITAFLARPAAESMFTADVDHPLDAKFATLRDGMWADFDVHDAALITVVSADATDLQVIHRSKHPADKAELAVGDGRFRVQTPGDGVLLVSSSTPLTDLDGWIQNALQQPSSLDDLARTIGKNDPKADIRVRRR